MGIKVLSLFDGKSGGQITLKELGIEIDVYCASEIDEHAIKVTQRNFPNTIQLGDVTKVKYENGIIYSENGEFDVGNIDLVIGGSPCQGFSVNGKKLNFDDPRSKLLFEFIRIKNEVNPKNYLLENVATMREDVKILIDEYIGETGMLINSNTFSAQNRKRYYWTNIDVDNELQVSNVVINDILEKNVTFTYMKEDKINKQYINPSETDEVITLNPKMHNGKQTYQQDRIYDCKGKMVALTATLGNRFYIKDNNDNIRKLTIREQARLQTVPEWYDFSILSDNQASKVIGNGWTIDVIKHILKELNT